MKCKIRFLCLFSLLIFLAACSKQTGEFSCNNCGTTYSTEDECFYCNVKEGCPGWRIACSNCGTEYSRTESKNNCKVKEGCPKWTIKCPNCHYEYSTTAEKNNCARQPGCPHYYALTCPNCYKQYKTEQEKNNCSTKEGCPKWTTKCNVCLTVYTTSAQVKNCKVTHDCKGYDHECYNCGKNYTTKDETKKCAVKEGCPGWSIKCPNCNTVYYTSAEQANCGKQDGCPKWEYKFHDTLTQVPLYSDRYYFGDWPNSVKKDSVTINTSKTITKGDFTYYKGSDGNYYLYVLESKCHEDPNGNTYKMSNGKELHSASDGIYSYFKVEPIEWQCVNTASNQKVLVSVNILESGIPILGFPETSTENCNRNGPGNHPLAFSSYRYSLMRAFLTGDSYINSNGDTLNPYKDKGFVNTAFSTEAQGLLVEKEIDDPKFDYESVGKDKVYLLSQEEITEYNMEYTDLRKKKTDYSIARGLYLPMPTDALHAWWSLRTAKDDKNTCLVYHDASFHEYLSSFDVYGIVPAITVKY